MSFLIASSVDSTVPRGSYKNLGVEVFSEGELYTLDNHTVTLYLSKSWTYGDVLLEKEGVQVGSPELGRVLFRFEPEDTKDLMCRSYDMTIFVRDNDTEEEWPILFGKFGKSPVGKLAITPTVQKEEEENG